MTPDELLDRYDSSVGLYRDFCARSEALLRHLLAEAGIVPHSLTSRVKERDSLRRKIQRREGAYETLSAVTDIAGVRITTFFADDVDKVAELIVREFNVDFANSIDKRTVLDPDRFGYLSLHFIVSFSDARRRLPEYSRFSEFKLEIQIRSILQHAWAEIEHDLGYKNARAVPREILRQFARLAGLLELADEQFVAIRNFLSRYEAEVGARIAQEPEEVLLNKVSIHEYYNSAPLPRELDEQIAEILGVQLQAARDLSIHLESLAFVGVETVAELALNLTKNVEAIRNLARYFTTEDEDVEGGWVEAGICFFYLCYILALRTQDSEFLARYGEKFQIATPDERREFLNGLEVWFRAEKVHESQA